MCLLTAKFLLLVGQQKIDHEQNVVFDQKKKLFFVISQTHNKDKSNNTKTVHLLGVKANAQILI